MSTGRDDDALSWGGDDDPTLDVGRTSPAEPAPATPRASEADARDAGAGTSEAAPALPDGFTAVGKGSAEVGRIDADGTVTMPADAPQTSNAMLVTLGVLAGVFLLFTIGWVVGGLRLQGTAQFLVEPVGYTVALWLAVAAPAVWFVTVLLLTRTSKAWVRLVWLIGGLALLVPWPFILVGAIGR
ncbi:MULTISPECIES: DNA polymerase III subunit gamma/tau [unclassified Microbacterium]|uniref:DNA polymerase III subunit gamma/tau n=1 Tax=unclassified Microbacterium TaxID=2609290 RepID=UPI003015D37C